MKDNTQDEYIQMSLFDMEEAGATSTQNSLEEAVRENFIRYGSGFENGKFRIEKFYREHKDDKKAFASFLSKEYGIGGHSGDGIIDGEWHDSKGIRFTFDGEIDGKTEILLTWNNVAKRLADIIESGEYISQEDIEQRIRTAVRRVNEGKSNPYYDISVAILDEYGLKDKYLHAEEALDEEYDEIEL